MFKIEITDGNRKFIIGKQVNGFVNVNLNFDPLDYLMFLSKLKSEYPVEYINNTAFYGEKIIGGGFCVRLNRDANEIDLQKRIQSLLDAEKGLNNTCFNCPFTNI